MSLSARTRQRLIVEGIELPADLSEYDANGLEKIFLNLTKPAKVAGAGNRLIEVLAYSMSGKSKMRIEGAAKMAKFYETIGRPLDPDNMAWPVIKNFLEQYAALKERKARSSEDTTVPKISKAHPVHIWIQSIGIYLSRKVGVRNAVLSYVIRDTAAVAAVAPPRAVGEPHSEEYGSIEGDQTHRLSHTHALFKMDNAEVFDIIEQAVRGSDIAATIAQYRRNRNGRGALQAIMNQHAGPRVWEDLVKSAKEVLAGGRKWTGTTAFTIAQHCNVHRKAFIALGEAAENVAVQIPDERTRVTNLMDSFDTVDPTVLAALSLVRQDELVKRVDFEATVTFLIQSCPVAAKQKKKNVAFDANVSVVDTATGTATKTKIAVGTSGAQLRYHKKDDFDKLNVAQKKEVAAWTRAHPKGGNEKKRDGETGPGKSTKKWKTEVAAMTAHNDEVMKALVDSHTANMEAMQAQASAFAGRATGTNPTNTGVNEESIRASERAKISMLHLQSIQKGPPKIPPKPAGKAPAFGVP